MNTTDLQDFLMKNSKIIEKASFVRKEKEEMFGASDITVENHIYREKRLMVMNDYEIRFSVFYVFSEFDIADAQRKAETEGMELTDCLEFYKSNILCFG